MHEIPSCLIACTEGAQSQAPLAPERSKSSGWEPPQLSLPAMWEPHAPSHGWQITTIVTFLFWGCVRSLLWHPRGLMHSQGGGDCHRRDLHAQGVSHTPELRNCSCDGQRPQLDSGTLQGHSFSSCGTRGPISHGVLPGLRVRSCWGREPPAITGLTVLAGQGTPLRLGTHC